MHDVWLMLVFGVVGYLMRKLGYPMAPAVLEIVLGPLAETSMRQSLLISDGSFLIFFHSANFWSDHAGRYCAISIATDSTSPRTQGDGARRVRRLVKQPVLVI